MNKYRQYIILSLLVLFLAAWAGRRYFRNLFPTRMKFKETTLVTTDSSRVSINDYKGSVVIVSCFQTWCVDCARETPVLNELAGRLPPEKFKVIYVTDEDTQKTTAFRNRFQSNNILFTYSAMRLSDLGIRVFPTTFLLDKKGEVIKTKLEGYNWMEEEEQIRELIAEP